MTQLIKQMVVVDQPAIHEHQQVERVGLFNADGTPYVASGSGSDYDADTAFVAEMNVSMPAIVGGGSHNALIRTDTYYNVQGQSIDSIPELSGLSTDGEGNFTALVDGAWAISGGAVFSADDPTSTFELQLSASDGLGSMFKSFTSPLDGSTEAYISGTVALKAGDVFQISAVFTGLVTDPYTPNGYAEFRVVKVGVGSISEVDVGGGTDLSALGLFVEEVPEWGTAGFLDPAAPDGDGAWSVLAAKDGEIDIVAGWGTGPGYHYAEMYARETMAVFAARAAVGQTQAMLNLLDENGTPVFSVSPDGFASFPTFKGLLGPSAGSLVIGDDGGWPSGTQNGLFWNGGGSDGAQTLSLSLGPSDEFFWQWNTDGSTKVPGRIFRNDGELVLVGLGNVVLYDELGFNGSGASIGIYNSGDDGDQSVTIQLAGGLTNFRADGSTEFPGPVKFSGVNNALLGDGTHDLYIGDALSFDGLGLGFTWRCDGTDGHQSLALDLGDADQFRWEWNADGSTEFPGSILGPAGNFVINSRVNNQIVISDAGAQTLGGTFNGIYWNPGNAADGEQLAYIGLGPSSEFITQFNADGSTVFPGRITPTPGTLLRLIADGLNNAFLSDALADAGTGNALTWVTDGTDGNQILDLLLGNSDQHWQFKPDGSTSFPGPIKSDGQLTLVASSGIEIDLATLGHGAFNIDSDSAIGIHTSHADGILLGASHLGFYNVTPVAQAAHPTVLADVITILTNLGLCAA